MSPARRSVLLALAATFTLAGLGAVALANSAHPLRAHSHRCRAAARAHRAHGVCGRAHRRGSRRAANVVPSPGARAGGGSGSAVSSSSTPQAIAPGGGSTGEAPAGGPTAPPSVPHVLVTAVEWSLALSRTNVPAGKVVLQFVDHGQDEHNLNLTSQGTLAGSLPNTNPEEMRQLTLNLSAGSYTLFCSLPEHEQRGMKSTLVVE